MCNRPDNYRINPNPSDLPITNSGEEGIQQVQAIKSELLILDTKLSDMSGLDVFMRKPIDSETLRKAIERLLQ